MRLRSVLAWRDELLDRAQRTAERSFPIARPRGVELLSSTQNVSVPVDEPVAAFGVAPNYGRDGDFHLAVRVFRGQGRVAAEILRGEERRRGEMNIATGLRYRPRLTLRAGRSCGHHRSSAGTLGAFVEDSEQYYLLSCNHVIANNDISAPGDVILQPGPTDIVKDFHVIGHLERTAPLVTQTVDAAIARFSDNVKHFYPWYYKGIGEVKPQPVSDRYEVTRVTKLGRSTRVTRGVVSAFELEGITVNYGSLFFPRPVGFSKLIEIVGEPESKPFSQPGDSGSLIIDRDTMRPYALLFGGSPDSKGIDRTLGHFIPEVLTALDVKFVAS